jgi:hypothetical protein
LFATSLFDDIKKVTDSERSRIVRLRMIRRSRWIPTHSPEAEPVEFDL